MPDKQLSGRQLACITAIYIIGSSSIVGNSGIAGRDTWFAMLLAVVAAIPLVLLYSRVSMLYRGMHLFDIIYEAFGKKVGWVVTLLMTFYCFQLGMMVLRDFPEYVHTTSLPKTPPIIVTLIIGFVCAYLVKLGIDSIGKAGIFFSWLVGATAIFTFLLLIPNMQFKYLRPMLAMPAETIGMNALKLLSTPFGETVVLLCVFCNLKPHMKAKNSFVPGLLFGGGYLVTSVLRNILALGSENFASLYFPSYNAVSTINVSDFFQRIEVLVASYLLICDIMKISICIYATSLGLVKLLGKADYKVSVLPVTLLMSTFSVLAFESTMQLYSWSPGHIFFAAPFQLLIPLALWIFGEVRRKRKII